MLIRLAGAACLFAALLPVSVARAASPAIECRHVTSTVDKQICADPSDVAIDREIAALYDRGLAEFSPADRHRLIESQRKFLHARAGCAWAMHSAHPGAALSECVRTKMEERLRSLRRAVDRGGYG